MRKDGCITPKLAAITVICTFTHLHHVPRSITLQLAARSSSPQPLTACAGPDPDHGDGAPGGGVLVLPGGGAARAAAGLAAAARPPPPRRHQLPGQPRQVGRHLHRQDQRRHHRALGKPGADLLK